MNDLQTRRTRYYLGQCDEIAIGMTVTETTTGQFDDESDEPFEIGCALSADHDSHLMRPVSEAEYEDWCTEEEDTWDVTPETP